MLVDADITVVYRDTLPYDGNTYEFEGVRYQDTDVSFIWVDMLPGSGVRLHKHPYKEIFIILEGVAKFEVDSSTHEAHAGQIIIIPADTAHRFTNSGTQTLKQVDIHVSQRFITEWLE